VAANHLDDEFSKVADSDLRRQLADVGRPPDSIRRQGGAGHHLDRVGDVAERPAVLHRVNPQAPAVLCLVGPLEQLGMTCARPMRGPYTLCGRTTVTGKPLWKDIASPKILESM
jgi:hypothetical protein